MITHMHTYFTFGATPRGSQPLFLAVNSEITPEHYRGPYGTQVIIESKSTTCKLNTLLLPTPVLQYTNINVIIHIYIFFISGILYDIPSPPGVIIEYRARNKP